MAGTTLKQPVDEALTDTNPGSNITNLGHHCAGRPHFERADIPGRTSRFSGRDARFLNGERRYV